MIVKCGRCREQFEASGPGRCDCPFCGTANEVPSGPPGPSGLVGEPAPVPPVPVTPPRRTVCPVCEFSFLVGEVETAPCPNCRETVVIEEA